MKVYGEDLAYIHDAGYGDFARRAAPWLLQTLRNHRLTQELVVDLGCGSGLWAKELVDAGYGVLGIDLSPDMIAIARQRVPEGEFRVASLHEANLPSCVAVTALGECVSYLFDRRNTDAGLARLFRRVYAALPPGGLFLFDAVGPGRVPGPWPRLLHRTGDDWAVLVSSAEDQAKGVLTRHIISFRKVGELYRREEEVHRQRLLTPGQLTRHLRDAGFRVRRLRGYGELHFARGHFGFLARKVGSTRA